MLTLFGGPKAERAKSITIGALASLLLLTLAQLANQTSQTAHDDQYRRAATQVAMGFAVALTTYDYAHRDVQLSQIAVVSSAAILDRVRRDSHDVVDSRASSLGAASDPIVASVTDTRVVVLVGTSQIVSSTYTSLARALAGLVEITVTHSTGRWVVADYRWLVAPGDAP